MTPHASYEAAVPRLRRAWPTAVLLMVLVGMAGCSDQGQERQTRLPPERVTQAGCPARDCLVIEKDAVYCSVDPHTLREHRIFATKSRLHLTPGTYPLTGKDALAALSIRIETPHGARTLAPRGTVSYAVERDEPDRETGIAPMQWIHVQSAYGDGFIAIDKFLLSTPRWPHDQFMLGDPRDTRWFFAAGRGILLRVAGGGDLYPGLAGEAIRFAPCGMAGIADQGFRFAFADGSVLELTARTVSGSNQIGYFVGRLMGARGRWAGASVDVRGEDDLALFGSNWSGGVATIPTFAVRTGTEGDACGFIFDSTEWESDRAVNGYVAYELRCDERRGRRLPLTHAVYPQFFALP